MTSRICVPHGSTSVHIDVTDAEARIIELLEEVVGLLSKAPVSHAQAAATAQSEEDVFLSELTVAQKMFSGPGKFVGVNFFVSRWQGGSRFTTDPYDRRRVLDGLVASGQVEIYDASGSTALRKKRTADEAEAGDVATCGAVAP